MVATQEKRGKRKEIYTGDNYYYLEVEEKRKERKYIKYIKPCFNHPYNLHYLSIYLYN